MYNRWVFPLLLSIAVLFGSVTTARGEALCLDPVGDIDGSGITNVVDVQCELLSILWTLGGEDGPPPSCIAGPPSYADVSCDNETSVTDAVLLIKLALNDSIGALDPNGNGCPDACEPVVCGDNECNGDESCESCPGDCGPCGPVCGDAQCTGDESCSTCPDDCGACCGDTVCDTSGGENCSTCPSDCGDCCGNNVCDPDETCLSCSLDCGDCCGDGACDQDSETCSSCPADCGECPSFCGDATCDEEENCQTCPEDCTVCEPFCGDFFCNGEETYEDCPTDCQVPVFCGNNICDGTEDGCTCPEDCTGCEAECGDGTCSPGAEDCESCEQDCGVCPSVCGNGDCEFDEDCTTCSQDCGPCASCGDGACNGDETDESCPEDCVVCGDTLCNGDETDLTCPADCVVCDDGFCNGDETYITCPEDCAAPVCGDGPCTEGVEDCENCPEDCGDCPAVCGDGECTDGEETCELCPADCGECPAVCGDDFCEANKGEDCLTCANDCPNCACGDDICQSPKESCAICADDCGACPVPTNNCCETSLYPECVDENITNCVCAIDQKCCGLAWDDDCIGIAKESCDLDCPVSGTLDCCISHVDPGCVVPGEGSGGATTHDVTVAAFTFTPNTITIKTGDTVRWTSSDPFSQIESLSSLEPFTSPPFGQFGEFNTFEHTYAEIGSHSYQLTTNNQENGTVIVEGGAETCTGCVCNLDDACCTTLWDASCVGLGSSVCHGPCGCAEAPTNSCCSPGEDRGCESKSCMDCVCAIDSLCCSDAWDVSCATSALYECNSACSECVSGSKCCQEHFSSSCGNELCVECVCAADDLCCTAAWDADCVTQAFECGTTCGCSPSDGCSVTAESAGTTNPACDECVCAIDASCCDSEWDQSCADVAAASCNYACGCGANGVTDKCGDLWSCAQQCPGGEQDCLSECAYNGTVEIQDKYNTLIGCVELAECAWDANLDVCAQQVCVLEYGACHATDATDDCCLAHENPSCPVPLCEDCVCQEDDSCCTVAWDEQCVTLGETTCKEHCVCVPTTPLEECAEVFECALGCPTANVGSCAEICISRGVGEAGNLMGPLATCLTDKGCLGLNGALALQACAEGLCSSSYNLCLAHQVESACCNDATAPCVDNSKCLECIANADQNCANGWGPGCNTIAETVCNGLCNCSEVTPTFDCAQLDGCLNNCDGLDQVCSGDCIAATPLDSYLEHAALKTCIHENGCTLVETEAQYQQCIQTECPAESGACFGGGASGPDPSLPALELLGVLDIGISGTGGKGIHLVANQNISDLAQYGLGVANNGGGTDGVEYVFPIVSASAGEHIIVLRDPPAMESYLTPDCFLGFAKVFYQNTTNITQNGDDAIELFDIATNEVIEVFGDVDVDGTNQSWEYKDSWAFKASGNWIFGGVDCTDDTSDTFSSPCPYPFCTGNP